MDWSNLHVFFSDVVGLDRILLELLPSLIDDAARERVNWKEKFPKGCLVAGKLADEVVQQPWSHQAMD